MRQAVRLSEWSRANHLETLVTMREWPAHTGIRSRRRAPLALRERLTLVLFCAGLLASGLLSLLIFGVSVVLFIWVLLALGRALSGVVA